MYDFLSGGMDESSYQALLDKIKSEGQKVKDDPAYAKQILIKAGIFTPEGEPSPHYYSKEQILEDRAKKKLNKK